MRGLGIVLVVGCASATVAAQDRADVLVTVETDATDAAAREWRRRVEPALASPTTFEAWARGRQPAGTVDPDALAVVERIQALLVDAKAAAARLRERDALSTLAEAEMLAESHLDVPGMSAWYAEVQLAIAVTAAQAGMEGLSEAALRRAASVDPTRGVQAAEARPEVVERGRAAIRAVAIAPRGRFEVRADVPGATVALDDRPLGALPRVVEAPVGPHVLRVDAPGHRGWARVITVFEGERPPVRVRLSPTSLLTAAAALEDTARRGDEEEVVAQLADLEAEGASPPRVWMLFVGGGEEERAVLVGCEPSGCGATRRLEDATLPPRLAVGEGDGALREALAWMREGDGDVVPPELEWWERWYVWVVVGAVITAGVTAAVVASVPQGPGPIRVDIEWGDGFVR